MGVEYSLTNYSKKETINFHHLSGAKMRELAGHPITAAVTTWYMLENAGDLIAFVSDTYDEWPFPKEKEKVRRSYTDVTDRTIESLVANGILADHGKSWIDPDEPDNIYERDLRNVWMSGSNDQR